MTDHDHIDCGGPCQSNVPPPAPVQPEPSDACARCGHQRATHSPINIFRDECQMCPCSNFAPGTDQKSPPPPLSEAEAIARHVAALNPWAGVVMAELDRVRAENKELRDGVFISREDAEWLLTVMQEYDRLKVENRALRELHEQIIAMDDEQWDATVEVVKLRAQLAAQADIVTAARALRGHWQSQITSGVDMTEQDLIAAVALAVDAAERMERSK